MEVLLAGYAIVTLPESLIPALVALEEIEFVEKPKELLYDVYSAKEQSCFPAVGDFPGGSQIGLPQEGAFYFPEGGEWAGRHDGAAPGARLLIVKLGQAGGGPYPRTTQLMRAMTYALNRAQALGMPLAVNLSFGNSYGAHDGSSLLEGFLDNASEVWKNVICVGSGNEGAAAGHVSGKLTEGGKSEDRTGGGKF